MKRVIAPISVLMLLVFATGCVTYSDYVSRLPADRPEASYFDGRVVHASIGSESAVEVSVRPEQIGVPVVVDVFVMNLSESRFNFGPRNVRAFQIVDGLPGRGGSEVTHLRVYSGAPPDDYAREIAERTTETLGHSGAVGAFLTGGSAADIYLASEAAGRVSAVNRNLLTTNFRLTRNSLIDITTLDPGEAVTGGIGFIRYHFSAYSDGVPVDTAASTPPLPTATLQRIRLHPEEIMAVPRRLLNVLVADYSRLLLARYIDGFYDFVPSGVAPAGWILAVQAGSDIHLFYLEPEVVP
ncbi:MAG: hypothetical protein EA383_01375 [Spirochaetaceae bacterium]|nr:MAG: hypothetical protein EA383_01375 [Spirochaetaceae bacterium]